MFAARCLEVSLAFFFLVLCGLFGRGLSGLGNMFSRFSIPSGRTCCKFVVWAQGTSLLFRRSSYCRRLCAVVLDA